MWTNLTSLTVMTLKLKGKETHKKAQRDQVKSALPQRAESTEEWGLKSQMEEFSR